MRNKGMYMKKKNLLTLYVTALLLAFSLVGPVHAQRLPAGEGSFVYTDYKPLADKPVTVRYYIPDNKPDAKVLFVMHGNSRNAEGYWKTMLPYAKAHQFLLIVPEFSKMYFPSSRDYHQGGMFTKEGDAVEKKYWAFSLIEPLFDYMKAQTGNTSQDYYLYGFSAGSQFVHRFLMFQPQNRVSRAIAGSAGTYTMPDLSVKYAYGLKNTNVRPQDLSGMLQKDVILLVGDADTVLSRADLVKTPVANKQGRDRVERGQEFYKRTKTLAEELKIPFGWKFALVPGAGHSQSQMASTVAEILFGSK